MRETKITNTELNWLYSALIAKWPIDPSYLMINRWCCEETSGSGDIGSGCYLSMLAISLKPGITRNPNHLLLGTSLGFEYMKKDKYISGNEREGLYEKDLLCPKKEVHNKIMCHNLEEFRRRQVTTVAYQCKHGGVVQPYPHQFVVPNIAFAEPYAHLPQPQQNVATIRGYAARNMQIIAAIQTNANQMG
jgi:hypothetical protein